MPILPLFLGRAPTGTGATSGNPRAARWTRDRARLPHPQRARRPSVPIRVVRGGADALGLYLTGAASDGAAQADPALALGNFRSSTESRQLIGLVSDAIQPVVVDAISGANGIGTFVITAAPAAQSLALTPSGGTEGTARVLADGDEAVLVGGTSGSKIVRISRDGLRSLSGIMSVAAEVRWNTVLAMDNVSSAERVAGLNTYHAAMLRGHGTGALSAVKVWIGTLGTQQVTDGAQLGAAGTGSITTTGSFADWPESGWAHIKESGGATREIVYYTSRTAVTLTVSVAGHRGRLGTAAGAGAGTDTVDAVPGIRIAEEAVDGSGKIQTIANDATAPGAVSWDTGTTSATGLSIAVILNERNHAVWVHRELPPAAVHGAQWESKIHVQYAADGLTFEQPISGYYRVAGAVEYRLYKGQDVNPDFTAAPATTSATLPFTHALAAPGAGERDWRLTVRQASTYDVEGQNQQTESIWLDTGGNELTADPSAPTNVLLDNAGGLEVQVRAQYDYEEDGADAADTWLVYYTDTGVDPDPALDTPDTQAMELAGHPELLAIDIGAFAAEADVRVIVRTQRSGDSAESINVTVSQIDVTAAPSAPDNGDSF